MKTVLVTGAASGIGKATAEQFEAAGWRVYATDVDTNGLDELAQRGCETHEMDVTDRASISSVAELITAESDGIDCLVNNAGYGQMGPVEDVPIEAMQEQFDVNYWGAVRCVKEFLPHMREQGHGTIVNVTSVMGRVTSPGWGTYCASKHALEGISDALRMEVDDLGVNVVLVEPAWVSTGFADRVAESIAGLDRTDCYEDVYQYLTDPDMVEGGPMKVSPEAVAEKITSIAAADDPDARYTVGLGGRLVLLSRLVPDSLYDFTQKLMVRRSSGSK